MPPFLRWGGGTEESRGEYEGGRERDCHPNIFCQPDFTQHGTCVTLLLQTSWPDQRVPRHTWHLSPTLLPFCQDNTTMSSYHHQVLVEMPLNQHLPPPHTHPKVSQTIYRVASDSLTHSCKQKAGLQTEASSLLPFFAGEIKSGNKYLMLAYFFHGFLLLLFQLPQRVSPVLGLNVLLMVPAPRSWQQQGEKPQMDRAQQTTGKEIIKQARLACVWADS